MGKLTFEYTVKNGTHIDSINSNNVYTGNSTYLAQYKKTSSTDNSEYTYGYYDTTVIPGQINPTSITTWPPMNPAVNIGELVNGAINIEFSKEKQTIRIMITQEGQSSGLFKEMKLNEFLESLGVTIEEVQRAFIENI